MPMIDSKEKSKTQVNKVREVSQEDREQVRTQLYSIGQELRRSYNMQVPDIRRYLHEMLDVSV